jgi:benzodiazapine receptor
MKNKWVALAALLALCLGVGAVAGFLTSQSVLSWFPTLVKPWFNPPAWLFAPVWTALYIMMAIAAWLVWQRRGSLTFFYVQLAANFLWSFLFFGLHSPGAAFVEIITLWTLIILTIQSFAKSNRQAAWLMAPYLAWVSFATVLNGSIWWLN